MDVDIRNKRLAVPVGRRSHVGITSETSLNHCVVRIPITRHPLSMRYHDTDNTYTAIVISLSGLWIELYHRLPDYRQASSATAHLGLDES